MAVAAGTVSSLGLKNDGTVAAWGNNLYGQTVVPAGFTNLVAIACGGGAAGSLHSQCYSLAISVPLSITSVRAAGQNPVVRFVAFAGREYWVQYSPSLNPASWAHFQAAKSSATAMKRW